MITLECCDCKNILGYAYSRKAEENTTLDFIDDPLSPGRKMHMRCSRCFAKFQLKRPDLVFTHMVSSAR